MDIQVASPRNHCPLPNEVLLLIFSEFLITLNPDPRHDPSGIMRWTLGRYRDLSNICKASKQLKAVAQPLLYRLLVTFPYHEGADKILGSMSGDPHLGEFVQDFDLRYTIDALRWDRRHGEWFEEARPHLKLPPELADEIHSVLSEVLNHYTMEARDALTAFWLSLMPNLKKLSLAVMDEVELTSAVLKHAVESTERTSIGTRPFSSLREVRFKQAPYKKERWIHITAIEVLFKLPSLTILQTSGIHWTRPDNDEAFIFPDTECSLQHLDSGSSIMRLETLKSILIACKELRTLRLNISLDNAHGYFPNHYNLGKILRDHGQNLERVRISFRFPVLTERDRKGKWLTGEEFVARKIGDLRCLSKLKHFRLSLPCFSNSMYQWKRPDGPLPPFMNLAEMLPPSLESLVLDCGFCDKQALVENLYSLLAAKETLPHLWCVIVPANFGLERDLVDLGWTWRTAAESTCRGWEWRPKDMGPYGLLVLKKMGVKYKFDMMNLDMI